MAEVRAAVAAGQHSLSPSSQPAASPRAAALRFGTPEFFRNPAAGARSGLQMLSSLLVLLLLGLPLVLFGMFIGQHSRSTACERGSHGFRSSCAPATIAKWRAGEYAFSVALREDFIARAQLESLRRNDTERFAAFRQSSAAARGFDTAASAALLAIAPSSHLLSNSSSASVPSPIVFEVAAAVAAASPVAAAAGGGDAAAAAAAAAAVRSALLKAAEVAAEAFAYKLRAANASRVRAPPPGCADQDPDEDDDADSRRSTAAAGRGAGRGGGAASSAGSAAAAAAQEELAVPRLLNHPFATIPPPPVLFNITFMLQFFRRPDAVVELVGRLATCGAFFSAEMIVNVDSDDAASWAAWRAARERYPGFLTLVVSNNVHELHGYNRLAAIARGELVMFLQDDELAPKEGACALVARAARFFQLRPRLGLLSLRGGDVWLGHWYGAAGPDAPPNTTSGSSSSSGNGGSGSGGDDQRLWEQLKAKRGFEYVTAGYPSPLLVRRAAFMEVGMLDEGVAAVGDCNIVTDHDLAMRLWVNGWHNALFRLEEDDGSNNQQQQQKGFYENGSGSSHAPGPAHARCWVAQWESVGEVVRFRWNTTYPWVWERVAALNRMDPLVLFSTLPNATRAGGVGAAAGARRPPPSRHP